MVIQRIQSLWLFIAAVLLGIFSFTTYVDFSTPFGNFALSVMSIDKTELIEVSESVPNTVYSWMYFALDILISLFIFIVIFLYKNIKRQCKYAYMSLLLTICFTASIGIYSYMVLNYWQMLDYRITAAIVLPICSIIFIILAIKGIKRDIRTLYSYDRIR
ncbi:MAG: DUF4293 domain-containing protein [Muribaculaceae bacterium]|nr:DUF4293 domain-containing protein [Muribaculaceae bacterium]